MTEAALQQICAELSRRPEWGNVTPRVVGQFSNLVVALDPLPTVARIATGTALVRDALSFARREVAICSYLSQRGAPVVSPSHTGPAGPHVVDGWIITLWQRVDILPGFPDPVEAAQRLAACHGILRGYSYPEVLPYFGIFDELLQLLVHVPEQERPRMEQQALECRSALAAYQSSPQPLHGDAHRKNVFHAAEGPLWADWEDTMLAPIEWDLACLVTGARINGSPQEAAWAEAALAAYGPHDAAALELCIQARALFATAWLSLLAKDNPERQQRLGVWLNWLRLR
jgi:Phosphotransferase enzyme family